MISILIGVLTLVLILVCVLVTLVILMQRPSADAGMGSSLGGGVAESAFGGETGNVLTRVSVKCIVLYFILAFVLYISYFMLSKKDSTEILTPTIEGVVSATQQTPATQVPQQ